MYLIVFPLKTLCSMIKTLWVVEEGVPQSSIYYFESKVGGRSTCSFPEHISICPNFENSIFVSSFQILLNSSGFQTHTHSEFQTNVWLCYCVGFVVVVVLFFCSFFWGGRGRLVCVCVTMILENVLYTPVSTALCHCSHTCFSHSNLHK